MLRVRTSGIFGIRAPRRFYRPRIGDINGHFVKNNPYVKWKKCTLAVNENLNRKYSTNTNVERNLDSLLKDQDDLDLSSLEPLVRPSSDVTEIFKECQALISSGKWDQAIELSNAILQKQPDYYAFLLVLGLAHFYKLDHREASHYFLKFLEHMPAHSGAHYYMAKCYFFLDDYENFLLHLDLVLKYDDRHVQANFFKGMEYFTREQYDQSIYYFRKVSFIDIQNYASLIYLGMSYSALGDYSSSNQAFESALDIKNNEKSALICLAENYANQGLNSKALSTIERLVEDDRNSLPVYTLLYKIKKSLNEVDECHRILEQMISRFPERTEVLLLKCDLYATSGKTHEALQIIDEQIIQKIPSDDNPDQLHFNLLVLQQKLTYLRNLQDQEIAIQSLENDISEMQRGLIGVYIKLAQEAENQKKIHLAIQFVLKAEKIGGTFCTLKGFLFHKIGQYEYAIKILNQGIENQDVNIVHARIILSDCYMSQNNYQLALENIDKAIELEEGSYTALLKKCDLFMYFGQLEDALSIADNILEIDKENEAVKSVKEEIISKIKNTKIEELMNKGTS